MKERSIVPLDNQNSGLFLTWTDWLKHNRLTVATYNYWLNYLCRTVECYVFVATTGRSGTSSLSRIFKEVLDDAVCLHEPPPVMHSDYAREDGFDKKSYFREMFYILKRTYIKRAAAGHRYYIETNHQFIKNFTSPAIEYFGDKLRIIHLKRDPIRVASSLYAINSIPGKTVRASYYLLDPDDVDNRIRIPELWDGSEYYAHDFYRCLWYWYEIEARVQTAKKQHPHVVWVDINTEDLNDIQTLGSMFRALGIEIPSEKLRRMVSVRENLRLHEKHATIDHHLAQEMNRKLRSKIETLYDYSFDYSDH